MNKAYGTAAPISQYTIIHQALANLALVNSALYISTETNYALANSILPNLTVAYLTLVLNLANLAPAISTQHNSSKTSLTNSTMANSTQEI